MTDKPSPIDKEPAQTPREWDEIIDNAMCDSSESERFGEASHAHERGFMSGFRYCEKMLSNKALQAQLDVAVNAIRKMRNNCNDPDAVEELAWQALDDIAKLKDSK